MCGLCGAGHGYQSLADQTFSHPLLVSLQLEPQAVDKVLRALTVTALLILKKFLKDKYSISDGAIQKFKNGTLKQVCLFLWGFAFVLSRKPCPSSALQWRHHLRSFMI